jgi:uncharacterized hydrophobic protein (TIGR00271 family)
MAIPLKKSRGLIKRTAVAIRNRFSLRSDRADDVVIDSNFRNAVLMQGTNLWVLMLAILIASIGLNVNSAAVIIGAMLISPLMGPIMGVGYGAGINDFSLVRQSLKNLGIATLIGLLTSAAYFLLSPLTGAQSELLARTSPTIWDVLIASFGGLAGVIAVTRKERSTVIPGVAIATALMPPLCTAGFGLANGNIQFFIDAFYLFTINCVFIAAATTLGTRAFRLEPVHYADARMESHVRLLMGIAVILTLLPSLYLAYRLVNQEVFKNRATQFVRQQLGIDNTHVVDLSIDPRERRIDVTLIGTVLSKGTLEQVAARLPREGLSGANLQVFQSGEQNIDVAKLKSILLADLYKDSQTELADKEHAVQSRSLDAFKSRQEWLKGIPEELHALFPQVENATISEAHEWDNVTGLSDQVIVVLNIGTPKALREEDRLRIEQWLKVRVSADRVRVVTESGSAE